MAPTTSFTPQQVFDAARLRHPGLNVNVITDVALVPDFNRMLSDFVLDITSQNDTVLALRCAAITLTGSDGATLDLNPVEGEILRLIDLEALKSGTAREVVLRDLRQRYTLKSEFADDARPVGCLWFDSVSNNRWQVLEVGGWTGVTSVTPFAVIKPAEIGTGALATQLVLPYQLYLPLIERTALLLGHKANIDDAWQGRQAKAVDDALRRLGLRFTYQAGETQFVPPADAPVARRPLP